MSWENILKGMKIEKNPRLAEHIDSIAKEMEFFTTFEIFQKLKGGFTYETRRADVDKRTKSPKKWVDKKGRKTMLTITSNLKNLDSSALTRYFKLSDDYIRDIDGEGLSHWVWVGE
jgi:hypothetical protein